MKKHLFLSNPSKSQIFIHPNESFTKRAKFSYKINCRLMLQPYSLFFYLKRILTNPTLD